MIHVAARPCAPVLARFVRSFHYHEGEFAPALERILPTGQAHLMFNLKEDEFRTYTGPNCEKTHRERGAILAGPHGKPVAVDMREWSWLIAVEFTVGGVSPFLPMPANEICDQFVELGDIWGRDGSLLREHLCMPSAPADKFRKLEKALLEHLARSPDPAVAAALPLLDHGASLAETRERVGLLPKTFVRRFREQVGLSPKRLSRVRRLQRVLVSIQRPSGIDWCAVAADHGYTDQAHFIHDFRDLTGMTPTAYRASSPRRRNHVPLAAPAG